MIATAIAERAAVLVLRRGGSSDPPASPGQKTRRYEDPASELHDLESLLRGMGYLPVPVDSADSVQSIHENVALCIVDLRQNGEALRTARAVRAQHPQAVVIGIADPDRPTMSADAILAGVFDVLPRPASARDLEALIANAREQASLAGSTPQPRTSEAASVRHRRNVARDASRHGPRAAGGGGPVRHPGLRRARQRPRDDRQGDPLARSESQRTLREGGLLRTDARRNRTPAVRHRRRAERCRPRPSGAASNASRAPAGCATPTAAFCSWKT